MQLKLRVILASPALASIAASLPVLAQETAPPAGTPAPAEAPIAAPASRRAIEEIVVTAQKKAESIQEVPISITALPGEFINDVGAEHPQRLVDFVPNVRFEDLDDGTARVYIRGFGTPFSGTPFESSVGLTVDELPLAQSVFFSDPLYDVERVEVLRGPQGILFGKNTTAGLFSITTRKPTREFAGSILTRIGGFGEHRLEAAVGGPLGALGDVAQFRLSVVDAQREGDVDNTKLHQDLPGTDQRGGRLQLAIAPLDDLDVLFTGERTTTDAKGPAFSSFQADNMSDSTVEFLRQYDPEFEDDPFDHQSSQDFEPPTTRESERLQANVRYATGDLGPIRNGEVAAVVGHAGFDMRLTLDADLGPADILSGMLSIGWEQESAELRYSGNVPAPFQLGEIELLGGFFYFQSRWNSRFPILVGRHFDDYALSEPFLESTTGQPTPGGLGIQDVRGVAAGLGIDLGATPDALEGDGVLPVLDQDVGVQAPFFRFAWHVTQEWTASVGGRLTFEQKDADYSLRCLPPGVLCAALMAEDFDLVVHKREADFSPHFTVQYRPWDDLSLFVTRATGFKSGGFNEIAFSPDNFEVDTETAVSWELGAKGVLLDGAVSYGGTLFNQDVEDLQLQTSMGVVTAIRNAASARSRGFELDFEWFTPWEPLSLRGAGSLTDAKFIRFPNATAPQSSESTSQDLSGHRMPFVAKRQLAVTPEIRIPFGTGGLPFLSGLLPADLAFITAVDVLYRSHIYLDIDVDPLKSQDDLTKLNARTGFATLDDALSVSFRVNNATDVDAKAFSNNNLLFPGFVVGQEFQRNFAVQLRYLW